MPLVIPEGYGEATITWQAQGRANPLSVTLGYLPSAPLPTPGEAAESMAASWEATGGFCDPSRMGQQFTYTGVTVHQNVGGAIQGGAAARSVVGTRTSTDGPMIIASTFVVSKRTAFIGRHFRGRMYVPIMLAAESEVDYLGNIDSVRVGFAQTAANSLLTTMAANDLEPVLLHYSVAVGPTIPPTPITSFTVSGKVGTQRRRIR